MTEADPAALDIDVIFRSLGAQIGQLTIELTVARAQIEALQKNQETDHE